MYCEKCRDKTLKSITNVKQQKTKTVSEMVFEKIDSQCDLDHQLIRENAIFLLDLAPMTNSGKKIYMIFFLFIIFTSDLKL